MFNNRFYEYINLRGIKINKSNKKIGILFDLIIIFVTYDLRNIQHIQNKDITHQYTL